jgi:hypothetical protein
MTQRGYNSHAANGQREEEIACLQRGLTSTLNDNSTLTTELVGVQGKELPEDVSLATR